MYTEGVEGVKFSVVGVPQQQGSKNPWGGEANKNLKPWRLAVSAEAATAMTGRSLIIGPVVLGVTFRFPRPKSHYGTGKNANKLKASAPYFKDGTPDLDKLIRAIGDALSSFVIRDDRQIVAVFATKEYGGVPGATITVEPLDASMGVEHELGADQGADRVAGTARSGVPG